MSEENCPNGEGPHRDDERFDLVYDALRDLAKKQMAHERFAHTLQPTAVVHEAWMRLREIRDIDWQGETHFKAMAARIIRRVLTDHARARDALKRGGGREPETQPDIVVFDSGAQVDLLGLETALEELGKRSERQVKVIELRYYASLTWPEIAQALGVSQETAKRDARLARAWLNRELTKGTGTA